MGKKVKMLANVILGVGLWVSLSMLFVGILGYSNTKHILENDRINSWEVEEYEIELLEYGQNCKEGAILLVSVIFSYYIVKAFGELVEDTREIKEALIGKADKEKVTENQTVEEQTSEVGEDEWKCTWCSKINKNDIVTCSCGCSRYIKKAQTEK